MTTLPDLTVNGEDIARLLIAAREIADDNDPTDYVRLIAFAFMAAIQRQLGFPHLATWIAPERLDQLEEAGAFPFWNPPGGDGGSGAH